MLLLPYITLTYNQKTLSWQIVLMSPKMDKNILCWLAVFQVKGKLVIFSLMQRVHGLIVSSKAVAC